MTIQELFIRQLMEDGMIVMVFGLMDLQIGLKFRIIVK